VKEIL